MYNKPSPASLSLPLLCLSLPLSLRIPAELHLPTEPPPSCTSFLLTERRIERDSERRLDKQEESAALHSLAIFHDRGGGIEKSETERTRERKKEEGEEKSQPGSTILFLSFSRSTLLIRQVWLAQKEAAVLYRTLARGYCEEEMRSEKKDKIWLLYFVSSLFVLRVTSSLHRCFQNSLLI